MAVTRTFALNSERYTKQLDQITKSHSLRGSESLCKLLQYLAKQAISHPAAPLKEYQIATEVYGRHADFDPQSDSTIRVQAGRLRVKLAEYYAAEGASDPIVVKIPKGSYHLVFEERQMEPRAVTPNKEVSAATTLTQAGPSPWNAAVIVLGVCLILSLIALGSLLWSRRQQVIGSAAVASAQPVTGHLAEFWRPFTSGPEQPWVIYSNAAFVGRPETGMRYYNPSRDAKTSVYDHYTGVGEVLAVHALDDVFAGLGRQIRVKRGS